MGVRVKQWENQTFEFKKGKLKILIIYCSPAHTSALLAIARIHINVQASALD